ncbi:MAG: glycosyltransferase family 4 protein [Iodobacter sp.]
MKIALFCNEIPPRPAGGIATVSMNLALGLRQQGHEVIFVETGENKSIYDNGIYKKITIKKSNLKLVGSLLTRVRIWLLVNILWVKNEVDVLEVPDFEGYFPFPSFLPFVVRLHNTTKLMNKRKGIRTPFSLKMYEYFTLKFAKKWIAPSNFIAEMTKIGFSLTNNIDVIYNPIDRVDSDFLKKENKLLFAGTIIESKGVFVLAQALLLILPKHPLLKVIFAGKDTVYKNSTTISVLKETLSKYADRVEFTGHVQHEKVLILMKESKCFILPSQFEAFGMVVAEAMIAGTPVIYTNRPPGPELIIDGETGILVNPDSKDEIANAIDKILTEPVVADKIASAAKKYALDNFSSEICLKKTLLIYHEII